MSKLPFNKIEAEALKLIQKIAESTSVEETSYYKDLLEAYLESVGWDSSTFDAELLKRIDANWEDKNLN